MCRMGCPETLITDQGREFVNELSTALMQSPTLSIGLQVLTTHRYASASYTYWTRSAWFPVFVCTVLGLTFFIQNKQELIWYVCVFLQTNGLTERFNQTISRCLAKLVDESQTNWDEKIDTVLMGYRAS